MAKNFEFLLAALCEAQPAGI